MSDTHPTSNILHPTSYRLLDFGAGRRLEEFGQLRLDRPCPAAERMPIERPDLWTGAHARFQRTEESENTRGLWVASTPLPSRWTIAWLKLRFELKPTEFGHLGLFPEQAGNWSWIQEQIGRAKRPVRVLNLFAYTGGSTLAAAAAGAEVTHVDSARNVVAWARRNAELSELTAAPIRWIAEDALRFVRREIRRGSRYEAVILDPPSYGHGPRGEVWRLSKHLPHLLSMCGRLTEGERLFVLLTCHTPGYDALRLDGLLRETLGEQGQVSAAPLVLRTPSGRELPSGVVARWERGLEMGD